LRKLEKKLIAISMSLAFLMSGLATASALTVTNKVDEQEETPSETDLITKTMTFYRCGLDGSVKTIELNLELEEEQDIGDALIAQCDKLLENDEEMQEILQQKQNNTFGIFVRIQSVGRGFHYKTMLFEKVYLRYLLWKLGFPRVATLLAKPLVFCSYSQDFNAKTIIKPLRKNAEEKVMEGCHSVIVNSFIGYTTWVGRFAYAPMTIIPRVFSGYARFAFCYES
jgi:hypothetical protein